MADVMALVEALKMALSPLTRAVERLSTDILNAALINNPRAFGVAYPRTGAASLAASATAGEAGVAKAIYTNKMNDAVIVILQGEAPNAGDTTALYLALDGDLCQPSKAPITAYGSFPEVSVVLQPNTTLWAAVSSGVAVALIFTVVPIRGSKILYPNGRGQPGGVRECE
ncbi:MAG: hypothetical protein Q7R39_00760 [Dehalococcoidia bacterium]|nr:hypothetical protein [Dehalococcoidia bacterium]